MFRMNPYAVHLGDRDARDVLSQTSHELTLLMARLGPEGLERSPGPGKWTARGIICHLADCEAAFAFRLRQTLAQEDHVIQPFDQERWGDRYRSPSLSAAAALETFGAVRRWNLALLDTVTAEEFNKQVSHPERGQMTFRTIIETMAGHDQNHLKQLQRIADAGEIA